MFKTAINIKGMHCHSCELLIEEEFKKLPNVKTVEVSHRKGTAEIVYFGKIDERKIEKIVEGCGYTIGKEENKPWISKNAEDYEDLMKIGLMLFFLYVIAKILGILNFNFQTSNNYSSLGIVLLIGLTAGVSTCMALVGGLVLGASARFAEIHPNATTIQKFKPHLFFNAGRIIGFFIFGGLIGFAGSFFQLSVSSLGFLTIFVGIVMFILGVQLTEIVPRLKGVSITIPKSISRFFGISEKAEKEYSHKNSMILGALTFFLPCGFTQAMQLFAISTGNPLQGALTMGFFAIGTAPGLLGIGGLTAVVKEGFGKMFFKFAGVVVILLAFFNIANGYNLTGLNFESINPFRTTVVASSENDPNVKLVDGVQIVRMSQTGAGYDPNLITIKKGIPVKWIIDSKDPNTCASTIVSSEIGLRKSLVFGENIFEFTPVEVGQIKFSCVMGMYTGVFNVVDSSSLSGRNPEVLAAVVEPSPTFTTGGGASCGGSGGGCGCGQKAAKKDALQKDSSPVAPSVDEGSVQVIKIEYTSQGDIRPKKFSIKKGIPVRMEIDVKDDGRGCMSTIMIPRLVNSPELLVAGKTIIFNFTPSQPGSYDITCAMGVPRGIIEVN